MFDAEKANFLAQFEQYKDDAKVMQNNLEKKYETQILFLTRLQPTWSWCISILTAFARDLENIQGQFQAKIQEFSTLFQQTQDFHNVEMKKITDSHCVQVLSPLFDVIAPYINPKILKLRNKEKDHKAQNELEQARYIAQVAELHQALEKVE